MRRFIPLVPTLAQDSFDRLLAEGCPQCRSTQLRFRAFHTAAFETLQGDVVSAPRWQTTDEELVGRIFRVDCFECKAQLFERDDCPLCRAPRTLTRALEGRNGLTPPPACPRCGHETLTLRAEVKMYVESLHGRLSRKKADAEPHDAGFHVLDLRCGDCDDVVAAADGSRCALCGRSSLLKALR
jgi:Zn finger protein HypA/HybF involved in hydrogenase expression